MGHFFNQFKTAIMFLIPDLRNWQWYSDGNMVHLLLHLIFSANTYDGMFRDFSINKGQVITTIIKLNLETKIPVEKIRKCIKRLELSGEILIKTTNKNSIITICKYDSYASSKNETNKQTHTQTYKQNIALNIGEKITDIEKSIPVVIEGENGMAKEKKKKKVIVLSMEEQLMKQQEKITTENCFKIYENFILNQLDILMPEYTVVDNVTSLKKIIVMLGKSERVIKLGNDIEGAFKGILDNYQHWNKFAQENILLRGIALNLVNIIQAIKKSKIKSNGITERQERVDHHNNLLTELAELQERERAESNRTTQNSNKNAII